MLPNHTFTKIEPIDKGWSEDKKYYCETPCGKRLLLRVADISELQRKIDEFGMLKKIATLNIPMPTPIEFGECNNGKSVYQLLGWVDGVDLGEALPNMSTREQYGVGEKSGILLRKLHSIPAPLDIEKWSEKFWQKAQRWIDYYNEKSITSPAVDVFISHIIQNKHLLDSRNQTFIHGDFNLTNIILTPDGEVGVIDFNAYNTPYGDPWWDFTPTNWGAEVSPHFSGLINGYFENNVPNEFFEILKYYLAYDGLSAICQADLERQNETADAQCHVHNIMQWYDNMLGTVPSWYVPPCPCP